MLVSRGARHMAIAVCAALVLASAACGKDAPPPRTPPTRPAPRPGSTAPTET